MALTILSHINDPNPDNGYSEDACGAVPEKNTAWALDGVTGIADRRYIKKLETPVQTDAQTPAQTDAQTDAMWYANILSQYLEQDARNGKAAPTKDYFAAVLQMMKDSMQAVCDEKVDDIPLHAMPCAYGVWTYYDEKTDQLHIIRSGDCTALVKLENGDFHTSIDEDNKDREIAFNQSLLQKVGIDQMRLRTPAVIQLLRKQRDEEINKPGGLWPFCIHPEAANHYHYDQIPLQGQSATVALMSDGLFRLVEIFECYSAKELLDTLVENNDPAPLIKKLRDLEIADNDGLQIKRHDDASLVLYRI